MPTNLLEFWANVYNFQDAAGTFHYKELGRVFLNILSVLTSHVCVERLFSTMSLAKSKLHNKMQYE